MKGPKLNTFSLLGLYAIILLARRSSFVKAEVWIKPCQASRTACDHACSVHRPTAWTCHRDTGYCVCPPGKSLPGRHCHPPKSGLSEGKECNVTVCNDIKKSDSHSSDGKSHHRKNSSPFGRKSHPTLFRGRKAIHAFVCSPDEADKQKFSEGGGGNNKNKEFAFCACFLLEEDKKGGGDVAAAGGGGGGTKTATTTKKAPGSNANAIQKISKNKNVHEKKVLASDSEKEYSQQRGAATAAAEAEHPLIDLP